MKYFFILALSTLTGCAGLNNIANNLPDRFDNVEFAYLVELNVISSNAFSDDYCRDSELKRMHYNASILEKYSEKTLNINTSDIYKQIKDLTQELVSRQDPSQSYCKIKRENISEVTDNALTIFGDRLK